MRVTVACPEALIGAANHLAGVLGSGPADLTTFRAAEWRDADANRYAFASWEASETWIGRVLEVLTRPDWDSGELVDLAQAEAARAALIVWGLEESDDTPPTLAPDRLVALAGLSGKAALSVLGNPWREV